MNTLLITGVTGFLGGAVLEEIINSMDGVNLLLLVRAHDGDAAVKRVKENMRKFNVDEAKLAQLGTQNILLGDLASPEDFLTDPRLEQVTHVLNCAAVASFGNNPLIWKVNVEGTLLFAQRMAKVDGLQRFLHVGTAMSCSPQPDTLVAENAVLRERAEHLVEYTHSKSTIEQLMRQRCPTLPLVIARPSIVVGHTHHGCQPSSSIFWVFSMGLMLQKFMCSMEDRIDVIPVDYCASALLMLLNAPIARGEVVHISAGEENSVRFGDIDNAMAAALEDACAHMEENRAKVTALRDKLIAGLSQIPHSALNGDPVNRLPGNVNFCFEGIEGESLLLLLDDAGICASSGSACTSGSLDPSHVLLAIGRPHEVAHGSLRLSLCEENTEQEVDVMLREIPQVIDY